MRWEGWLEWESMHVCKLGNTAKPSLVSGVAGREGSGGGLGCALCERRPWRGGLGRVQECFIFSAWATDEQGDGTVAVLGWEQEPGVLGCSAAVTSAGGPASPGRRDRGPGATGCWVGLPFGYRCVHTCTAAEAPAG